MLTKACLTWRPPRLSLIRPLILPTSSPLNQIIPVVVTASSNELARVPSSPKFFPIVFALIVARGAFGCLNFLAEPFCIISGDVIVEDQIFTPCNLDDITHYVIGKLLCNLFWEV